MKGGIKNERELKDLYNNMHAGMWVSDQVNYSKFLVLFGRKIRL